MGERPSLLVGALGVMASTAAWHAAHAQTADRDHQGALEKGPADVEHWWSSARARNVTRRSNFAEALTPVADALMKLRKAAGPEAPHTPLPVWNPDPSLPGLQAALRLLGDANAVASLCETLKAGRRSAQRLEQQAVDLGIEGIALGAYGPLNHVLEMAKDADEAALGDVPSRMTQPFASP